ncbi:hypothetical protein A2W32_02740 [candidate division WWE3 bacterium RBG_16_37_10]|uniref:Uncharacterized protein n=1 Tax=candidate division WWE3 bacterium RBG_16_37_10 TaxID=1802610 RepID=A0A1F4V586_UNCKA|nr:MAG: hypothetical protein A2W32_02740 [candidate division WWE3 bacterium RBG_16_37_10]
MKSDETATILPESTMDTKSQGETKNGIHGEGTALRHKNKAEKKEVVGSIEIETQNVIALEELSILLKQAKAKGQNTTELLDQVFKVEFSKN